MRVENEKFIITVEQDDWAESPREWDNLGTMVTAHGRYNLGEEEAQNTEEYSSWDEWLNGEILNEFGDDTLYLPLYLYDHSGLTISTAPFSCKWDSGQVGYIYITRERIERELLGKRTDEEILQLLRNEVKTFDDYLTGNVWSIYIQEKTICDCCGHTKTELIDSCGGFYGDDYLEQMESGVIEEALELFRTLY